MEAAIAENRVTGVVETSVTRVATVVECCTDARAATGADEVESTGGRPRMGARVEKGKADWVLDSLDSF